MLDALTSVDMSVYGYRLPTTPRLDEITRTWTVFENAHTAATATTAAQPTILTGRYPFTDEWYRYGDLARSGKGLLNLPRILQATGYETIYAQGGGWSPSRYHLHSGFDRIIGGGFPQFQHPRYAVHTFPGRDLLNTTLWNPAIAEALLSWQPGGPRPRLLSYDEPIYDTIKAEVRARAQPGDTTPFFLYLHAMRPHHPYFAGEFLGTFLPRADGMTTMREQNQQYLRSYKPGEQEMVDRLRLRYDENILKADQELGDVIDTLKQAGIYDQSLIIITSDHGTNFEHGNQGYFTQALWAAEHRVPLLVKFPGQTTGRRVAGAVSTVDILPTVLDVIGAAASPGWLDGQSLRAAEQAPDRIVYVSRIQPLANLDLDRVAAIQGDYKLVRRGGKEALFNLALDPEEVAPLDQPAANAGLRMALDSFVDRAAFLEAGGDIAKAPALAGTAQRPAGGP
jgi:choline-sulfatase